MYVADRKPPGSPALPSWPARSRTLSDPRFYARVGGINWDTVPSPCPSCCSPPRWPFQAADGSFDSSLRARLCVCRERAVGRRRARVVGRRKNATREPKTTFVVLDGLGASDPWWSVGRTGRKNRPSTAFCQKAIFCRTVSGLILLLYKYN